jgi:hypothetical protein
MAVAFYRLALENKIDPSVGFILQIPPQMRRYNTSFWKTLSFCLQHGVDITPAFFQDLDRLITENGIQPVTPLTFVVSKKKATTLSMYIEKQASWGVHIPFFFQTCPDAAFYIYRTSADALHDMAEILTHRNAVFTKPVDGSKISLKVDWILEHVVRDNPCYALFDLDDYPRRYQGRIDEQEIKTLIQGFPARFLTLMIESGCLDDGESTVVDVKIKDRSRLDKETGVPKLSYHNIFSVFASKTTHRHAMAACLQMPFDATMSIKGWLDTVKESVKSTKDYSILPTDMLKDRSSLATLISLDQAALPGGANGITTFGSVKKLSDPSPIHGPTTTYCLGLPISVQPCPYPAPHDMRAAHLTLQDKLRMLYSMSYTIPKSSMTFYSEAHLSKPQQTTKPGAPVHTQVIT